MFEYFISLLTVDAFLAKLLKDIGLSDALTGVLSSLISFTFLFQLLSIPLAGRLKKVKKPMIVLDTISQLLFASLYIVPFMKLGVSGKGVIVTVLILTAYLMLYLNSSICYKWGNSFVLPEKRGSFSATKEMISLLGGVFFTLGAGFVLDKYEAAGNLHGGFKLTAACMVLICLCNFLCFFFMEDKTLSESKAKQNFREVAKRTFGDRNVRNAMILMALTDFSRYMVIGFMGTYKNVDLGFSISEIQLINVIACLVRFAISKPLGKYSDRKSFAEGYYLGTVMAVICFTVGAFITVKTRWLIIPFTIIYNMSQAGTGQNSFSMIYAYVEDEYILSAMAVNNSVRGTFGFIASFIGSLILDAIQKNGNSFMGMNVCAQQVLCALSAVLVCIALIFNKKVVSKQTQHKK